MEIRNDFYARLEDSCRTIPTEAVSALLRALLPREEIRGRSPSTPELIQLPNGEIIAPPPRKLVRKGLRLKGRVSEYRVLVPNAHGLMRYGSWRRAMTTAAVACQPRVTSTMTEAFERLKERFPEHAAKGIDFRWLAKEGIITFDIGE